MIDRIWTKIQRKVCLTTKSTPDDYQKDVFELP